MKFKTRMPRIWKYSNGDALVSALERSRPGDILLPQHPLARGSGFASPMRIERVPDIYRTLDGEPVIANGHFVGIEEVWA